MTERIIPAFLSTAALKRLLEEDAKVFDAFINVAEITGDS